MFMHPSVYLVGVEDTFLSTSLPLKCFRMVLCMALLYSTDVYFKGVAISYVKIDLAISKENIHTVNDLISINSHRIYLSKATNSYVSLIQFRILELDHKI